jgi:pilus assembly protein CpaB
MNLVRIIVLIVAGLAALAAAFFVRGAMQPAPAPVQPVVEAAPAAQTSRVLVASRDIAPGERVTANDFRWAPWPEEAVLPNYVNQAANPDGLETLTGAVARTGFAAGEPANMAKLIQPGDAGFMSAVLTPGMRAVAVPISARSGAGGFILPNDRVDIIVTRESANGFGSDLVVENVRVLAIDQIYSETEDGAVVGSTATLELSSSQARSVALAVAVGDVSLALRSIADTEGGARFAGADETSQEGVTSSVRVFRYGSEQRVALGGSRQ